MAAFFTLYTSKTFLGEEFRTWKFENLDIGKSEAGNSSIVIFDFEKCWFLDVFYKNKCF